LLYQAGVAAFVKNRRAEALRWFEECLKREPNNVGAANNVAYLLTELSGQDPTAMSRALKLAEQSYRQSGGQPAAADTFGWALFKSGRAGDALPLLQRAIVAQPDDVRTHYHIACTYQAVGQVEMARHHFEHVAGTTKEPGLADEARKALLQMPKVPQGSRPSATTTTSQPA